VRATWLVSIATAFVLLGASITLFLNPVWVGFEQGRAGVGGAVILQSLPPIVEGFAGCDNVDVRGITSSILHDLVLGGDFDVRFGEITCRALGAPNPGDVVLTEAERSHMRDVRGVFAGFGLLVLASIGLLVLTWRRARGDRTAWWRAVRAGAAGLAVAVAVLGAVSLFAFDAAFEVFHRLFFAAGSYDFDPATSRLIQLFPDQFWSDTTLALGVVAIVLAVGTAWLASRRIASASGAAATAPASLQIGKAARP